METFENLAEAPHHYCRHDYIMIMLCYNDTVQLLSKKGNGGQALLLTNRQKHENNQIIIQSNTHDRGGRRVIYD